MLAFILRRLLAWVELSSSPKTTIQELDIPKWLPPPPPVEEHVVAYIDTELLLLRLSNYQHLQPLELSAECTKLYRYLIQNAPIGPIPKALNMLVQRGYDAMNTDMCVTSMLVGIDKSMDWYAWMFVYIEPSSVDHIRHRLSTEFKVYTLENDHQHYQSCDMILEHGRRTTDMYGTYVSESIRVVFTPNTDGHLIGVQCIVHRSTCSVDMMSRLMAVLLEGTVKMRKSIYLFTEADKDNVHLLTHAVVRTQIDPVRYPYNGLIHSRNNPHNCWHNKYYVDDANVTITVARIASALLQSLNCPKQVYTIGEYMNMNSDTRFNAYTYKVHTTHSLDPNDVYEVLSCRDEDLAEAYIHCAFVHNHHMIQSSSICEIGHMQFDIQLTIMEFYGTASLNNLHEWHEYTNTAHIIAVQKGTSCVLLLSVNNSMYNQNTFHACLAQMGK